MKLATGSTPKWLHIVGETQETWIHTSRISGIETRGQSGKPDNWSVATFAIVRCRGGVCFPLDEVEWEQLKSLLGLGDLK